MGRAKKFKEGIHQRNLNKKDKRGKHIQLEYLAEAAATHFVTEQWGKENEEWRNLEHSPITRK